MPQPVTGATNADDFPSAQLACAGYGSIVTVTAVMGMAAAADTIRYVQDNGAQSSAQCQPPVGVPVVACENKTNLGPDQPAQPLENT